MNYTDLGKDIENFVRDTFNLYAMHQYPYHNLVHTVEVVGHARNITRHYADKGASPFVVTTAAWFHDIGHLSGPMEGHEERGVLIMEDHLHQLQIPEQVILSIAGCIRATKYPSYPTTLNEEILCDADTFHFGTEYFRRTDEAVRREVEIRTGIKPVNWHKKSIYLLQQHRYFTAYCQMLLDHGKQRNIEWLQSLAD
ncbi:MAG TPA: HD domain-containing protein [Puia sp.]|nr:HD domain-containing protein [Puia sp.]